MMRLAAWCALVSTCVAVSPAAAGVSNPHNSGSCVDCHERTPTFGIDTRRTVSFRTTADDPALCAPCHPDGQNLHPVGIEGGSGPAGAQTSDYLPLGFAGASAGRIVCSTCHFIHAADGRHGLLRGFPGTPDPRHYPSLPAFCADCHGGNLAERSPHGGGERSCGFCHQAKPRPDAAAVMAGDPGRCLLCHAGVKDAHFKGVDPLPGEQACHGCHDPHARSDERPMLLNAAYLAAAGESVVIRPHYRKGLCFACHANTDDYALREEDVNALCDRCHGSGEIPANIHPLRRVPAMITVPKGWPLAAGALTCLTCHEQGHEDQTPRRWMLRGGPYASSREVCRTCHTMTDLQQSRVHVEINAGASCGMCHKTRPTPGKDTIATVTFIADPDLLCLRCHDDSAKDDSVHHGRVTGREVEQGHLADGLPLYRGRVICATCHNPHQLEAEGFRLRQFLHESTFCTACHSD